MPTDSRLDPAAPAGLMQRLRDGTADLHTKAESHPFQTSLVRGEASRADYARWLAQMLGVHDALENALIAARAAQPEWAAVIREDLLQVDRLRQDLRHVGAAPETMLPATAAFRDWIEQTRKTDPVALLGVLYVLEGSKNGNRFIARALQHQAGLPDRAQSPGYSYLDPHGDAQRPLWLEFKRAMDALSFAPAQADSMLDAARETFCAVTHISEELVRAGASDSGRPPSADPR